MIHHFTTKHILLECTDFAEKRTSCYQANDLKELFKDVPVGKILSFLRQVICFIKYIFLTTNPNLISYTVPLQRH